MSPKNSEVKSSYHPFPYKKGHFINRQPTLKWCKRRRIKKSPALVLHPLSLILPIFAHILDQTTPVCRDQFLLFAVCSYHCLVCSVHCVLCMCELFSVYCALFVMRCALVIMQCALFIMQRALFSVLSAVCTVQSEVFSVQFAVWSV